MFEKLPDKPDSIIFASISNALLQNLDGLRPIQYRAPPQNFALLYVVASTFDNKSIIAAFALIPLIDLSEYRKVIENSWSNFKPLSRI